MKEYEALRQQNLLITKKQYKILIIKVLISLILPALICIGGLFMMVFTSESTLFFCGLTLFCLGGVILVFMAYLVIDEFTPTILLYRHYKKHPEDFEDEID